MSLSDAAGDSLHELHTISHWHQVYDIHRHHTVQMKDEPATGCSALLSTAQVHCT